MPGLSIAVGAVDGKFLLLQLTSVLFFVEYLVRTTAGFPYSPLASSPIG